ncbi:MULTISPECIES: MFS transporter [Brucella/Ochrobactrum group]|uniref:MFS transporter n=1 Tax=Brucella/Ochrobactrum group TaxID=2826938 RepID=UPI000D7050FB|nr:MULTISPECIES: MFS transporter [Brucella/Ochrobactrum group]MCH4543485.1 MFS transporter [Ochrobactrum sp. A-1]PWU75665.1 MFS transporter [Ochrobactrum sp. POC9]
MQSSIEETIPAGDAGYKPAGWGELLSGKNGLYALALAGGVTLHAVNMYIATTVMPSVVQDIGGMDFYAWATTLFVVASILGAALTARLLKSAGPRGAYVVATLLFAAGTLISSLAINMPVMLAGRSVQGLGGGFLYALAYGLTRVVLPERLWGRAIGLISAMFGVATLIGPAIGGIFAEYGAWRAAFWSLLPVSGLFAVVAFATLPRSSWDKNERVSIPILQLILLTGAVLAVSAGSLSQETLWKVVGLGAAIFMIAIITVVDRDAKARLLPRRSFSLSTPLGPLYLTIALLMLSMQPEIYVPYLLQHLHGQSPLWAGYLAALMAIGWTVASFLSSRWQEKGGDKLVVAGPVLALAGLVLLAIFLPIHGNGNWLLLAPVCLGLILIGLGIGLAWPSLVTRVYQSAPSTEQDLAAGGMTTVQLFAIAFGTACAGMIANFAGIAVPGGVEGAANASLWLSVIFALAPAVAVAVAFKVIRITGVKG